MRKRLQRRELLTRLSAAGAAAATPWRPAPALAGSLPETTTIRLQKSPAVCVAPLALVTKTPQQIIAAGADWRHFEELKRELRV